MHGQKARGHLLAAGHHHIVFRRIIERAGLAAEVDEAVGSPAIAETTTATSWPAACWRCTIRATRRIRSVPAIEVPPNFITIRANACAPVHLPNERILPAWPMDHANAAL
jgi:hypothetical protein